VKIRNSLLHLRYRLQSLIIEEMCLQMLGKGHNRPFKCWYLNRQIVPCCRTSDHEASATNGCPRGAVQTITVDGLEELTLVDIIYSHMEPQDHADTSRPTWQFFYCELFAYKEPMQIVRHVEFGN